MATIISRGAKHFHYANRCLSLHRLSLRSHSNSHSPSSSVVAGANLHDRDFPLLQSGLGINYLAMYMRRLYGTGSPTADSQSPASERSTESNSSEGDDSGKSNQSNDAGKSVRGGPVSWLSFLLLVATGAGLVFYYDREKKRHIEEINKASIEVKQGPSVGKAAIGGPFKLINHDGKKVTEKDFFGRWTLVYFGFTHCPDICPDELQKLAAAVDKIKEKAGIKIVPVFISVDPERDTVEQVREYVKEFHPDLVGLTGTSEEIRNVARAYRVYYMKTEEEDSDYLVDHSIVMYLMGPKSMEFVKFFGKNNDVDSLADGVIKEIKQYKK
ncbi:protein SCO1 homolog 1, mitochondrial isoform X1 [Momordica charantia]|uniref:Protein SCO1 homolog 1, mitochondrial isoform X1 n=1 Tax=Momordica charantia TaxID=3673 RepID=A0A6J1DB88_MOMCH|nr:protein SCO1 homolog 1, mitochondrial isoform X1 [Momordica charantia]